MIQQGPAPPEHCDQQARTYRQLQIAIHYRDGKGMHVLYESISSTSPKLGSVFNPESLVHTNDGIETNIQSPA